MGFAGDGESERSAMPGHFIVNLLNSVRVDESTCLFSPAAGSGPGPLQITHIRLLTSRCLTQV